jgi:DNA-binding Lrp family transcriptional regulator
MSITAVTDPRALGYEAGALIGLGLDGSRDVQSIVADLLAVPQLDYLVVATGRFPVYAEVFCRSRQELLEVTGTLLPSVAGVQRIETFPYLSGFYLHTSAGVVASEVGRPSGRVLDETDLAVLRELAADARVKAQHIARRLDVSESQIRNRIRRMTDEGTMRVIAIVNPLGNDFTSMAWVALRVNADSSSRRLARELSDLDFVTYVAVCAGRFDVFAEVAGESPAELLLLIDDQIRPLGGVSDIEISLYLDLNYRPLLPA